MSDLPSRGNVSAWLHDPDRSIRVPVTYRIILDAYAEGRLVDRETIDYEAAMERWKQGTPFSGTSDDEYVRAIIAAAFGDEEDEEFGYLGGPGHEYDGDNV